MGDLNFIEPYFPLSLSIKYIHIYQIYVHIYLVKYIFTRLSLSLTSIKYRFVKDDSLPGQHGTAKIQIRINAGTYKYESPQKYKYESMLKHMIPYMEWCGGNP